MFWFRAASPLFHGIAGICRGPPDETMSDYSDDDAPSLDPPRVTTDTCVITPVAPSGVLREETFTVDAPGAVVKVQLVCLKNQLYVWVGALGGEDILSHGEMSMALPGRGTVRDTSVAALTNSSTKNAQDADRASDHLAARLSKRTNRSVVASCNLSADLRPVAEKAITEKLKEMGI